MHGAIRYWVLVSGEAVVGSASDCRGSDKEEATDKETLGARRASEDDQVNASPSPLKSTARLSVMRAAQPLW
eukprot:scaffold21180_cov31-Tisochrysis_lutea.AAC.6